ncbi:Gamma-aminobutyric acid type B receptor subunit 2 [Stylophora pistillata]|uniref:Gamma-aminobutyric acid type B receptor subunit 2 n=1 Tax=Stylophora pistillata TaxID=50429 RepID=A0A2B4S267_STYPI|nr:Gamma-aminobutyric acid type B receptor subunit 2 [Stylophora pistillata]
MALNDTKCDPGVGMHILYDHIYKEPKKIMLLGAAFSPVSQPIADTAKYWNLVQVSYASTSPALSNRERYPRFFRTISSDLAFNPARAALLSKYGWKRVATLHQNEPSGIFSQATKELHKLLAQMKVEVVAGESFTGKPTRQLANIKEKEARIIIGSFYEPSARQVFCEAYKKQMFGKRFVWIIIGWYEDKWWEKRLDKENVDCSLSEMSQAVEGYLATDHMKLNEDDITSQNKTISGWTAEQYANEFKRLANISAVHESSFAYDATWAIAWAFNKSIKRLADRGKFLENFTYTDTEMADVVQEALNSTSFLGVTGLVSFTKNGERIGYIQIEQLQDGESKRVAVYDPTTNSVTMNKREPIRWQGSGPPRDRTIRVDELKSISRALYGFMSTLAVLGIFLGLVFLLINFWYRERRIIKMSSPRLNNVIVVGCIMTYFSVILFGLDGGLIPTEEYGKVCIARAWIMSIGFTLAFGAMFAKTWRVHAIFKSLTPKKKVIRDEHLFLIIGAIVLLDILLLSLWSGIEPMHTGYQRFIDEMQLKDDKEIIPRLEHCESKNLSYWLGAVYAFKGLLLVFGVFLAWETRAVTIPALNDSRYIGMSVYNVVILSILGVAITSVIRDHQDATFAITAVFIIFCTTLTLCFVFVPKVLQLCSPDGGNEASNTHKSTANNPDSLSTLDKNAVNISMENSKLKKQLSEREQHLMELKRLLEKVAPDLIDDKEKKFKKRQSLVTFKKPEPSYTNDNYESDERISSDKGSGKKKTNSSDSGVKI